PAVAPGLAHATVLGAGGRTFGLGFYASPKEFEAAHADPEPETLLGRHGEWAMLYGPLPDMPFGDVDLWEEHRLPVAGPSAYPVAIWFGPDGQHRRPRAPELAHMEAPLLALAQSTEAATDRGPPRHEVRTHHRPRTATRAISQLLAP